MATKNAAEAEAAHDFALFIKQMEGGILNQDLADELRDMNARLKDFARENGKAKGEIVLKLKFNVDKGGVFDVEAETKVKTPKARREKSVFWSTQKNSFTPENPKQLPMFGDAPRVVEAGPRDVREPESKPREVRTVP